MSCRFAIASFLVGVDVPSGSHCILPFASVGFSCSTWPSRCCCCSCPVSCPHTLLALDRAPSLSPPDPGCLYASRPLTFELALLIRFSFRIGHTVIPPVDIPFCCSSQWVSPTGSTPVTWFGSSTIDAALPCFEIEWAKPFESGAYGTKAASNVTKLAVFPFFCDNPTLLRPIYAALYHRSNGHAHPHSRLQRMTFC